MSEHHTVNLEGSDGNASENRKAGLEGSTKTSKKRTRDSHAVAKYKCHITNQEKAYKRIVTSVTQPSTLLGLGLDRVRPQNRVRLCSLLLKLMRQHNMVEASGVLSILLKGTCKDKGSRMNRLKYSVSMELLTHIEFNDVQLTSIDRIYDTWMTRIGIDVTSEGKKNGFKEEDGIAVRLESILYQFMQGKIEGERQNARSVMRGNDYNYYPFFNVIMGLIFYQLFYSSLPEDMQYKDFDEIHGPTNSDMSAVASQLEASATNFRYEIGVSDHNALFNDESKSSFQCDSETSVMDGKEMLAKASDEIKREVVSMEVDFTQQRDLPQGFYVNSAENESSADNNGGLSHSIRNLSAHNNLESWLLPFQSGDFEFGKIHDHEFEQAVEYLQAAVSTTPPSLAALLPLIQLLLIRCQYKEALQELEKFCEISNAALTRLRGCLLEHVDPHDNISLSTSYEDTLKRDPTCNISLSKLISMHQNGNYGPESLLEMIALHLDVVFAEYTVWRDFALCFLKVSLHEQDCMSMCLDGNEGGEMKGFVRYNSPKLFIHGKTGKAWRLRSRWWLTRHFSKSKLASEMASGDMQLPAYKAACASQMYGPRFDYVVKVFACLEKIKNRDLIMFLQLHMKTSIGFYSNCQERTN